ncbi:hypothetical protein [Arthrobacter sp. B0490]|uniref:hypothetical protein n=1 Tax=Arthrobacter sp. B0490 TaxID=2058891 RepID=UPI002157E397|nr:hypothetical protein [Arthrobacter sp. B0490]
MTLHDVPSSNGRHGADKRSMVLVMVLRVLVAVALIVSALIHLQLAAGFQQAAPSGVGGGNLFRIQGAVAVIAALYVLVRGTPRSFLLAALVALASLVAVIAYRYIQIPTIGPIPSMYEPVWYTTKTLTALAEALALILALTAYTLHRKSHR